MKRALLFPGQGSQKVGMGRELAQVSQAARRVFEEVDEALGAPLSRLCWEGPQAELTRTENAQPAILTCSIAALRALEAERGPVPFEVAAGHSLGEWSALVAAGALELADAARLVRLRGRAMQEAVPENVGAMAAIIGLSPSDVFDLCARAAEGGQVCQPANFNGGGQIVISGHATAVERAMAAARERGARAAIALRVSAPFHCALMQPAADRVHEALWPVRIARLAVPVVANVNAHANQDAGRVKDLLVAQVTAPVRWEECVERLVAMDVTRALVLGAGATLRDMVVAIAPGIAVRSIAEPADMTTIDGEV